MWECQKCHEKHEDAFESCWNCGTFREGTEDPAFQREAEAGVEMAEAGTYGTTRPLVCCKCGSPDMIQDGHLLDRGDANWRHDLEVEVNEKPDALFFTGAHRRTLRATICGRCGYTELYVSNPQELLGAYRRSKRT
jgi:hypothetical protein